MAGFKRYASAAMALLLVVALSGWTYSMVRDNTADAVNLFAGHAWMQAVGLYLLVFIGVLFVRYGLLMLYSFLEHLEHLTGQRQHVEPQDATFPMVSLVVPAYNEGPVIEAAIASLLVLDYPNYEVLVVDDGSTDDTYDKALAAARRSSVVPVRVITKKNGGKSDALNTGMMNARGEFILNMDGDTKLSPNTLRACIRHFDDPRIGAVAGNVKVFNRENLWTRVQALEYVEGLAMARKAQSYVRSVSIIPGPLGMFRKSVLQEVGGYDHDTYAEDCDLTLKLLMRGWHVAYEPTAVAMVETPSRLLDLLKQRYRWTRGILQAIRKHRWALWQPRRAGINCFILWYMLFEGVVWPISTVLGSVFFVYLGLSHGLVSLLFFWWLQLTVLDLISAAYCVVVEEEEAGLIWCSLAFRTFYITIIDVSKVFATLEEWRGTTMGWGKLQREGKL
jgi:poly-beta-1,6 N-acetyl-D-glucosamine synthase